MDKKLQDQYFGNYRGTVRAHGDNGYCKIFFPGIYDNSYETKNAISLPWAEPAQPLFAGGASGNGIFQYPDIGATVWGFFEGGNINRPVFFANTNNNKNKFVIGENSIQYNNVVIKLEANNNVSVTTTGTVTVTSPTITAKATTAINVNAPIINAVATNAINVNATTAINVNAPAINVTSPAVTIASPQTNINGALFVNGVPVQ